MHSILEKKWLVFIKIAELGSLTRAATAFDVPQSMISRHLAQLENHCRTRLFRRTGRGVVLTEFGELIYPRIKTLIAEADQLADDIRISGGVPMGEVSVGILPSTVHILASRLFIQVRQRFSKVKLLLSEGASPQLEERLREGRIDMALLLREGPVPNDSESLVAQVSLRLVGPRGDPIVTNPTIAFNALQSLPLVVPGSPHSLRTRLDALCEMRGVKFDIAVEADSIRLQHEIVAAGGGYAITAGLFGMSGDSRFSSALIVEPELLRSVVLATTLRRPHTMATREVYRLIAQTVPDLLRRDD